MWKAFLPWKGGWALLSDVPCSQLPDAPHLGLSCPALSWFSALSSFAWEPLLLQCLACREGMAQPNFASQPPGRGQGC